MSDIEDFVELVDVHPPFTAKPVFWASVAGDYDSVARVHRAESRPAMPLEAVWQMSKRVPGKLIGTSFLALLIVRDDVATAMEEASVTGWRRYPVAVVGRSGETYRNYTGIAVSGRHGPADLSALQLARVDNGIRTYTGARFRRDSWDGSDLSVQIKRGQLGVYATPRAATLLKELCGRELETRSIGDRPYTDLDLELFS